MVWRDQPDKHRHPLLNFDLPEADKAAIRAAVEAKLDQMRRGMALKDVVRAAEEAVRSGVPDREVLAAVRDAARRVTRARASRGG